MIDRSTRVEVDRIRTHTYTRWVGPRNNIKAVLELRGWA